MRLFQFSINNETYIVAAETTVQALKYLCDNEFSGGLDDLKDEIKELLPKEWSKIIIRNTDYDEDNPGDMPKTFTLKDLVVGVSTPWIVSSTTYD